MNSNCRTLKRAHRLDLYDLPRKYQFYLAYFEYHDNWWRLTKHWTETQSNVSTRYGPFFVWFHLLAKIPLLLCILLTKEPAHDTKYMYNKYILIIMISKINKWIARIFKWIKSNMIYMVYCKFVRSFVRLLFVDRRLILFGW